MLPKSRTLTPKLNTMLEILNSVLGTGGPLVIEHRGKIFVQQCILITSEHVDKMKEKLKQIDFTKIEQTSDRSFSIS